MKAHRPEALLHSAAQLAGPLFGDDAWAIRETDFQAHAVALRESLFALGNGQLGVRGDFEEGYPQQASGALPGTYWNGAYVRRPIIHAEHAPGFPHWGDFMPALMNARELELTVDGTPLRQGRIIRHQRELDLRHGQCRRETQWRLPGGAELSVQVTSLVSFTRPGLIAQHISLRVDATPCHLRGICWLRPTRLQIAQGDDPRISGGAQDQLHWLHAAGDLPQASLNAAQQTANLNITCAVATTLKPCAMATEPEAVGLVFEQPLAAGAALEFQRFIVYQAESDPAAVTALARDYRTAGFAALAAEQQADWQAFWRRAHFSLPGQPLLEQGLRFNLFQLRQSCSREASANIAAKGLSGPGYDGHYFWDSEIYVLPLFSLLEADTARSLLRYRIARLPQARRRAREMSHPRGALYPWRTISGDECSAFFPAATAQYHINADIAYAVQRYARDSGDEGFVLDEAAEMLLETARIWLDLGHFNPLLDGQFTIHEVTGPDEYTALVDNNYYTNLLAARHLAYAAHIADQLATHRPQRWQALTTALELDDAEVAQWRRAATRMYLPHDAQRNLSWQDDRFAQRPPWDYRRHPADETPMLLKHHPLVLYRHQILKQADVLMAHYLCPEHSSRQRKHNDYRFYEPLTTHDSSLSPCVHSIIAAWCGADDKALAYLHMAVRSDLDDLHGNSNHGLHIASMAGSLACLYHGFAGLHCRHRDATDDSHTSAAGNPPTGVALAPSLPPDWPAYTLRFSHHGSLLELHVQRDAHGAIDTRVSLLDGPPVPVHVHGRPYTLLPVSTAARDVGGVSA